MPSRTFPCGHRGKGQHCHACAQRAAARAARETPRETLIRAYGLREAARAPLPACERALAACASLAAGAGYRAVGGKIIRHTGQLSVPLGWSWRLVCDPVGRGQWRPRALLSHEAYNHEV